MLGTTAASCLCPPAVFAQSSATAPPIVVSKDPGNNALQDLKGVPDSVKALVGTFDKSSSQYLDRQQALLLKLKSATTSQDRAAIRDELQNNRQAFLTELKTFRAQLRDDLTALKGKVSQAELQRVLDAGREATDRGDRHKGKH